MGTRKRHRIQLCETCGKRRWTFSGWHERYPDRRDNLSISFCSQGHPIIFKIGWFDDTLRQIMLPGIMEILNQSNPLMSVLKRA